MDVEWSGLSGVSGLCMGSEGFWGVSEFSEDYKGAPLYVLWGL